MIFRIIGIANVEDFKNIKDEKMREVCEKNGLTLGEILITQNFQNLDQITKILKLY